MGILSSILGAIPVVGPVLGGIGDVLGSVLGGASGRSSEENIKNDQNKIAMANATTSRMKEALAAPGSRLHTALQAALTQAATPAQVHWGGPGSGLRGEVPTFTGGINSIYDAMRNPDVSSLSKRITADELASQMAGGPTGKNLDLTANMPTDIGQESTGDKFLGAGGIIGSILGGLSRVPRVGSGSSFLNYGPTDPNPYAIEGNNSQDDY